MNEYWPEPEYSDKSRQQKKLDIRENPRRKKRRRRRRAFLFLLFLLAVGVGGYFFATSDAFIIKEIDVKGNSYYTKGQVVELSEIKKGDNLWKTKMLDVRDKIRQDPYIADVKIDRKPFHSVLITVTERQEALVCEFADHFVVMDYDGYVLKLSDEAPELPVVCGLKIEKAKPGQALKVKNNHQLSDSISLLMEADKNDMYFFKLEVADLFVNAYIYDNLCCRGSFEHLTKSVAEIRTVFIDLRKNKIKRGTIIVSGAGSCTFSPEISK